MKDRCVVCGVDSPYDESVHVDLRFDYVEGVGQLCKSCAMNNDGQHTGKRVCVSSKLIESTPNDSQLGEIVRDIYRTCQKSG
jgi:hypothetical protein